MLDLSAERVLFQNALLDVDRIAIAQVYHRCAAEVSALEVAEAVITPALGQIASQWEAGEAALSEIYMASRMCEDLLDSAVMGEATLRKNQPTIAIAAFEECHLLGKRLVHAALRAAGFQVLDYGHAGQSSILEQVARDEVQILLLSTLMLRSALRVETLRESLLERGLHPRIMVGGAPFRFDPLLWKQVGADAMGSNCVDAVAGVELLSRGQS